MPISQTEGYLENPYCHFLEEPTFYFVGFKMKRLTKKRFPVLRQKPTQSLP